MITRRILCRSTKFMVDGQGKTWYNIACDFPSEAHALVWLSWQSSSLVMSRSPVRIRPQAPKKQLPIGCCFFIELVRSRSLPPPRRENPATSSKKATPERVLLSCLKRQIDALCTKRLLVIIIAGICTIIMAKYRSKKVHLLPSAAFCRMRSPGVERKCLFSTNCPCICCLFVVFLIASKRFVVCIWGIACR